MITHKVFSDKNQISVITYHLPSLDQIKFAIFCAEDCLHLNSKKNKQIAKECIDLVNLWLESNETYRRVINKKLRKYIINTNQYYPNAQEVALVATSDLAMCVTDWEYCDNVACDSATAFGFAAKNKETDYSGGQKVSDEKLKEYRNLSILFFSTTDFQHTPESKSFLKEKTDKASISALIDYLLDHDENIILFGKNKVKLNTPENHEVEDSCLSGLIDKISSDKVLVYYLRRLYYDQAR